MPSARDEFIPDTDVVGEVIDQSIAPLLKRFEKELKRELPMVVQVRAREEHGPSVLIADSQDTATDEPVGEIRLRFRRTYKPTRYLFHAQALFQERGIASDSGLSGFTVKGDVNIQDGQVIVGEKGWTGLYNFWDWRSWV